MLLPRVIPCLLIHQKGLFKTVKFKNPKYVGDPLNAVKIFNEKQADELMVLDIDATSNRKEPNYKTIANLAIECRMPLCYGGGIKSVEQAQKIFSLGVEKIALSSAIIENPKLIKDISIRVGAQSIVAVLDLKKRLFGGYDLFTHNASRRHRINVLTYIESLQDLGVGEIVINSIDKDGTMTGYDFDLLDMIKPALSVPVTVLGGAGNISHIAKLVRKYPIIGAASGSLFIFKGKYRAVLINYPTQKEKENLLEKY